MGWPVSRPGPGGRGGGATYIPQNDPHDALIILNIHKLGQKKFEKNCPSAKVRPGFLCSFPLLNSQKNSEYFEYRHIE